ncbi:MULTISPECIES: hypothetical protein [unclassified Microbacterium]|uniref:hypothetical protein n=1 Tax=unclassified Microbacterium TaxID=2609290 RepID=UPI0011C3ABB1|nr:MULTISPECIES: hypothetical protein [unclassified Microbacterium]MBT2486862.1 hypothetical protein [Microbacterium sp. ISL-108]
MGKGIRKRVRWLRERLQQRLHRLVAGAVLAVAVLLGLLIFGVSVESAALTFAAGAGIAVVGIAWGIGYATISLQRLRLKKVTDDS